ncbi:MAG: nicotinate-nucleotide--dimethylbenzimidazole phosphoribosyltransferase [Candidatus Methylopumilus sp.]|nr:nicotinate-nucleotide--dimethylbenzimidazole phosphoribosyltransferase [Candidatus Methylopumilus sp.]
MFTPPILQDLTNPVLLAQLQLALNNKTKPLGSLGELETLAIQLGVILQTESPRLTSPQLVVFAADHGLAKHGISAYPSDVTWQMVDNFLTGGAAVSVLARQHQIALTVADCGVMHDFAAQPGLYNCKIAYGTADTLTQPAMSIEQCGQALSNGQALINTLPGNALLLGEMGIGNTSAASLLLARLSGFPLEQCIGAGTGLDQDGIQRKTKILQQVLQRHPDATEPLQALAAFGGFEIATMVGAIVAAAASNRVIVVDGFITSAAVLIASRLDPLVLQRCVFSHRSAERGHALLLEQLGARPLLDLQLRLGEGSGAALAWPLLVSACSVLTQMASFTSAKVSPASS